MPRGSMLPHGCEPSGSGVATWVAQRTRPLARLRPYTAPFSRRDQPIASRPAAGSPATDPDLRASAWYVGQLAWLPTWTCPSLFWAADPGPHAPSAETTTATADATLI